MKAFHDPRYTQAALLAQIAGHRQADQLIKGQYWENGKGCAIGCSLHSHDPQDGENRYGIPVMLWRLEDMIFEKLPNSDAQLWPERFAGAFVPGRDYSLVGWQFLHWLLTDSSISPGIWHPIVRDAVAECASVIGTLARGETISTDEAESAANAASSAANAAENAALSAAIETRGAARVAWRAANAAASAALSAAEGAARATEIAARTAEIAARRVAWSMALNAALNAESAAVGAAWSAGSAAAYASMTDKLIELIERVEV